MKTKKRVKIISDKLFNELWNEAIKENDEKSFIKRYSSFLSDDYVDFKKKYNMDIEDILSMLAEIYRKANLSIKDILDNNGLTKKEICHTFCIPKRTVEDWYYKKNKCPQYIKLMILRHYYLINLGNYIKLESEIKRSEIKPHIYIKHKEKNERKKIENNNTTPIENKEIIVIDENESVDLEYPRFEDIFSEYERIKDRQTKEKIQRSLETRVLLEKTSYLDRILKSRK